MQTSSPNKQNTDAPSVDMAELKLWEKIVVVAQCFLPRVGLRLQPQKIDFVNSGFRRIFSSGKKHCGVLLNVSCH